MMSKLIKIAVSLTFLVAIGCSENIDNSSYAADENSQHLEDADYNSEASEYEETPVEIHELPTPEVPRPASGLYSQNLYGQPAIAPLEIRSQSGSDYFVKVTNQYTGEDVSTIYIRGGDTISIEVPLGTYEIKYASGETWYGDQKLFGTQTSYSKADELFTFSDTGYQITGYTITLYQVVNGNLQTITLDPSQF